MTRDLHVPDLKYWMNIVHTPNRKQVSPFVIISGETIISTYYLFGVLYKAGDQDTIIHSTFGYRHRYILTYRYTGKDIKQFWMKHKGIDII